MEPRNITMLYKATGNEFKYRIPLNKAIYDSNRLKATLKKKPSSIKNIKIGNVKKK